MIKIDIIGDFREELDETIEDNFELYLIDQITRPEDFQEVLIVYPPTKKRFRWKAYTQEEAEVLFEYVKEGGILVLIPPFNPQYLEKTSLIYEKFQINPVLCKDNLLSHVNPHMISLGEAGKRPIKKYTHFLIADRKSVEIIIEGNWIPIFALKFIGKGVVVLYGLGSTNFWAEDLPALFNYLKHDYNYFWDKSALTENQLVDILKFSREPEHKKIRDSFIRIFTQKKRFKEFLEIKNPELREVLLQKIESHTIAEEYRELSGKFIVKKYREHYKLLNKDYPDLVKKIQQFIYHRVLDKTINEKTFNKLYESDLLPAEAAYLVIFYLDPENPENYQKFKDNLSKLILWNKKEQIFEEEFLKELAWDHL